MDPYPKSLGGSREHLSSRISKSEFAAPVYNSGLSKEDRRQVEMVRNKALAVILDDDYQNYAVPLGITKAQSQHLPHY